MEKLISVLDGDAKRAVATVSLFCHYFDLEYTKIIKIYKKSLFMNI